MIIYHTTFHISHDSYIEGLEFLKKTFIPAAVKSGIIHSPRIQKVLDDNEDGVSVSIQFKVADRDTLEGWFHKEGGRLHDDITNKYNDNILFFSTLLEEIDLT
jgi:hypothetical protein